MTEERLAAIRKKNSPDSSRIVRPEEVEELLGEVERLGGEVRERETRASEPGELVRLLEKLTKWYGSGAQTREQASRALELAREMERRHNGTVDLINSELKRIYESYVRLAAISGKAQAALLETALQAIRHSGRAPGGAGAGEAVRIFISVCGLLVLCMVLSLIDDPPGNLRHVRGVMASEFTAWDEAEKIGAFTAVHRHITEGTVRLEDGNIYPVWLTTRGLHKDDPVDVGVHIGRFSHVVYSVSFAGPDPAREQKP